MISTEILWPDVANSTYQNPNYGCKLEIHSRDLPASAIVYFVFITVEATSLQEKVLGSTYHPLFLTKENEFAKPSSRSPFLHKGHYQLPIYS